VSRQPLCPGGSADEYAVPQREAGATQANETCPRPRKDQEQSVTGGPSPEGLDVDHLSGETLDTRRLPDRPLTPQIPKTKLAAPVRAVQAWIVRE
jgi:hypothetical protein